MAVWSPGFYRVEDYAERVEDLTAKALTERRLKVEHPEKNRWKVETGGRPKIVVSYRLICRQALGHDQLCRRGAGRLQRGGELHHAGRANPAGRTKSISSCRRSGSRR